MNIRILYFLLTGLLFTACGGTQHEHTEDLHAEEADHEHEEVKIQFAAYSKDFEVFAEADAFVAGQKSNVLSHFTYLNDFSPLDSGKITLRLIVGGKEVYQTIDKPLRKGIYSFDVQPESYGEGELIYEITTEDGIFSLSAGVTVYKTEEEADEAAEAAVPSQINTTVFTKEQSWKVDFATVLPAIEPFGQVIKTTAQVQSAQSDEMVITAKTNGIVLLTGNGVLEGKSVFGGQVLFSISGSGLANDNSTIRYLEAKNNYEKATADYERSKELADEKIVSEKDLLIAKNEYENTKAVFENLSKNFDVRGQNVTSPINGFIKQLFVQNGDYVEAGQPIATVSQNKMLLLHADVQQKYASVLNTIQSATIRNLYNNKIYSLEQLNGKVASFGKSTNDDNYLIPVNLQIENEEGFFPGSFVDIFLKTVTSKEALTVPNSALMEEQGTYFVYTQITPELFEKREIKIGATDGLKTEIIGGINQNERVVSKGAVLIKLSQSTGTLDAHSGHVH